MTNENDPNYSLVTVLRAEIARLREALETLISAVEADGVPGFIYDDTKAECGQCGASAPTIAEVKHADEWCFQRAYEIARAALAADVPTRETL
jgi:hypothetical protein